MTHPYEQNFGADYQACLESLGEWMHRIIRHFGAHSVYGVGGDFAANLIAALDKPGLGVKPSSNEMHAGFCACAQAEVEGIGFCLTTYTVGSLPCVSAAALAKTESLPVVFISGAPGEDEVHQMGIHHMVLPGNSWKADYDAALESFAALGIRTERLQGDRNLGQPNISAYRFFELVKHAWLKREPVFIEVPRNLVFSLTQPINLPSLVELENSAEHIAGAEFITSTIVQKLKQAKKPLIYFGEQVKRNKRLQQLVHAFCHRLNIPYAGTWFAKGVFDETDPLCLGMYNGVFSHPQARQYIEQDVDYVLDIGTSVFAQDSASAFNTGTHKIFSFNNRTIVKSTADRERDLCELMERLLQQSIPSFSYHAPKFSEPVLANEKMDFNVLTSSLNSVAEKSPFGFVYVPEVGNSFFASYGLRPKGTALGINWLCNPWYAAMGTSLPYARVISESIQAGGHSDRVVIITGDGGFHFQLNELIHFLKQNLPLIIIYMRNEVFHLGKSGDGAIYHCSTPSFNVHQLISAYGGQSNRCESVAEFESYYRTCIEENQGIKLIEVPCSLDPKYQSREVKLLNLYIKARNGDPHAISEWQRVGDNSEAS